jgi:hypothetical protein
MKKFMAALFIIPLTALLLFSGNVFAGENSFPIVTLSKDEVVNHDYFAVGDTVNLSGTVNGDAYVAGGNVTFDGVVNGDLLTAGGNVTILGKVNGNIRAAGGNIILSSDVEKNATILGGSVSLSDNGKIAGSLVSAGGNISLNSPIGKGVNAAGGQISFGNLVGATVNAYTSSLVLSPATKITGDLNYWSENKLVLNPEASIAGQTNYHYVQTPKYKEKESARVDSEKILGVATMGTLVFYIYSLAVSLIIGLIIVQLLPVFTEGTLKTLESRSLASLGIGFLTVLLFPLVFIILCMTIIGIPLALLLFLALALLWFIAETFVALYIGTKVLNYLRREKSSKSWSLLTGLLVLGILSLIPIINFFVGMLTYLFGIGALLIQKKTSYSILREKKLI